MVVNAFSMPVSCSDRSSTSGEYVLFQGDNASAVTWVNKCGGTRDAHAGFNIRWLKGLELNSGLCFEASHISGDDNDLANVLLTIGVFSSTRASLLSVWKLWVKVATSGGAKERFFGFSDRRRGGGKGVGQPHGVRTCFSREETRCLPLRAQACRGSIFSPAGWGESRLRRGRQGKVRSKWGRCGFVVLLSGRC